MGVSKKILDKLSPELLQEFGVISVLAGSIEFWLERLIWTLKKEGVQGNLPSTDRKPVSILLEELSTQSEQIADNKMKEIISLWLDIATPVFKCRNAILHGIVISYGNQGIEFITNTRWKGEIRKRKSASFYANESTLPLLSKTFQVLLNAIAEIEHLMSNNLPCNTYFSDARIAEMKSCRSSANEIVDLAAAYNCEKY